MVHVDRHFLQECPSSGPVGGPGGSNAYESPAARCHCHHGPHLDRPIRSPGATPQRKANEPLGDRAPGCFPCAFCLSSQFKLFRGSGSRRCVRATVSFESESESGNSGSPRRWPPAAFKFRLWPSGIPALVSLSRLVVRVSWPGCTMLSAPSQPRDDDSGHAHFIV